MDLSSTKPIDHSGHSHLDGLDYISASIAAQSFSDYLDDKDTDDENSILPPDRRWAWYCKLSTCPKYYSAWSCKSNFLLHLYETPEHYEDKATHTRQGRRELAQAWREETAYDMSEPKKRPPQDKDRQRKDEDEMKRSPISGHQPA